MASERMEGPTPNGGAYAVITYRAEDGAEADKEGAAGAEVIEFNDQDEQVFRTYASFKPGGANEPAQEQPV